MLLVNKTVKEIYKKTHTHKNNGANPRALSGPWANWPLASPRAQCLPFPVHGGLVATDDGCHGRGHRCGAHPPESPPYLVVVSLSPVQALATPIHSPLFFPIWIENPPCARRREPSLFVLAMVTSSPSPSPTSSSCPPSSPAPETSSIFSVVVHHFVYVNESSWNAPS